MTYDCPELNNTTNYDKLKMASLIEWQKMNLDFDTRDKSSDDYIVDYCKKIQSLSVYVMNSLEIINTVRRNGTNKKKFVINLIKDLVENSDIINSYHKQEVFKFVHLHLDNTITMIVDIYHGALKLNKSKKCVKFFTCG